MGKKKRSNWNELCDLVSKDDGLPTRDSGYWAAEKLFAWNRYIEITTTAMVGHENWSAGVSYVDLFSGPGICHIRSSGERIPGSPLIAAYAPKPFDQILLCDIEQEICDACNQRLIKSPAAGRYQIFQGDCNTQIASIVSTLNGGALTLAFLDPTGLHLHFNTVQTLSSHGPVDLLILFPDAVDIMRNAKSYYFDKPQSNLDKVLGEGSDWRKRIEALQSSNPTKERQLYADIYKSQLRKLAGYKYFAEKVIYYRARPLYKLVYATKNSRGLDFWNKSVEKEWSGQEHLFEM